MAKKDLSPNPKKARMKYGADAEAWWYEENGGIEIHIDPGKDLARHISFVIPWRSIRRALARKDK